MITEKKNQASETDVIYFIRMRCVLCIIYLLHAKGRDPNLRIIGGFDADEEELTYIARLQMHYSIPAIPVENGGTGLALEQYRHMCTCAILTPVWTLTANHCITKEILYLYSKISGTDRYEFIIRYGSIDNMTIAIIQEMFRHPAYKYSTLIELSISNDIGLIKTEEIHLNHYGRVSAMDYKTLIGLEALATGHGLVNGSGVIDSATALNKPLQKINVAVIKCSSIYKKCHPSICVARRCADRAHICPGDSGGPLLHSTGIIGVNTAAIPAACMTFNKTTYPVLAAMTPISPYIDWITGVMNKDV